MLPGRRLTRMTRRALLAAVALLLTVHAHGDGPRLPPPPTDGLYDDSSVLTEAQRATASRAVADARAAGVDLYIALYRFIVGETIEERAERLKDAWCPDGASLIVVADTSTEQCTYLSHVTDTEWLSTTELQRIFTESSTIAVESEGTSAEKILLIIENLSPRLVEAMGRHHSLTRHRVSPRAWVVFAGVTGISMALAAIAAATWRIVRRRRQSAVTIPRYFPTVIVGERFGGPFGGGVIAEVRYRETNAVTQTTPTPP